MEPMTVSIGAGIFAVVSAIGTGVTVYYKLSASFEKKIDEAIASQVKDLEARTELRIQALDLKRSALEATVVRKEDVAELKSDMKNLVEKVADLKGLLEKALER